MSPRPTLGHIRRPQIIEAALQTMYERGFSDTRIADIARRAGTSPATILYYFESKEKLLEEAMASSDRQFYDRLREQIAPLESAAAQLVAVIEQCSAPIDPLDDWTLWMEMWLQVRHRSQMREAYERLERDGLATLIVDVIDAGMAAGEFSADVDSRDVAAILSALIDGLGVQVTLQHSDMKSRRMVLLCMSVASRELGCELRATADGDGRPDARAQAGAR